MDTQYLKSKDILLRRKQRRENNKLKVRVTKCYLVQVVDEEENEKACEYVFANSIKEADKRGRELLHETVAEM